MNIIIRTDASIEIGSGHVMRCLTLADQLRTKGAAVSFISRELPGNLCDMTGKKGYTVHRLPFSGQRPLETPMTPVHARLLGVEWETDSIETQRIMQQLHPPAAWLIVDHYALDRRWETQMRPFTRKIMVIDDIADRPHDCDVLLDQNLYRDMETRYNGLVPKHCKKFLGPAFALLRPEFIEARKNLLERDGSVKRILIFFGGSDPTNETTKALDAVATLNRPDIAVDVVVGSTNPYKEQIRKRCAISLSTIFHCQVENMAVLMAEADLAIGAAGSTSWERCALGLPTIAIAVADNQISIASSLAASKALIYLGPSKDVTAKKIHESCIELINSRKLNVSLAEQSLKMVDGKGCDRVADSLLEQNNNHLRILMLGPQRPDLIKFLESFGDEVVTTEEQLTAKSACLQNIDYIVSYGYRHIMKQDVLDLFHKRAINLHISYLPWNKGADPNLWSILEDTPKGVTIHYMDKKLDAGAILSQVEVSFMPHDTLRSSYAKLIKTIEHLFMQIWPKLRKGEVRAIPMLQGGSYHKQSDRAKVEHLLTAGWDTEIGQLLGMALKSQRGA